MKRLKREGAVYDGDDNWVLECSGRRIYANGGIIGIDPHFNVAGGYDGGIDTPGYEDCFTKEERIELADHMIALWEQYKNIT